MSHLALRLLTRTNPDLDATLAGWLSVWLSVCLAGCLAGWLADVADQGEHIMEQSTRPGDEHETEEYKSLLPSPSEMKLMRDSYKASKYHGPVHTLTSSRRGVLLSSCCVTCRVVNSGCMESLRI